MRTSRRRRPLGLSNKLRTVATPRTFLMANEVCRPWRHYPFGDDNCKSVLSLIILHVTHRSLSVGIPNFNSFSFSHRNKFTHTDFQRLQIGVLFSLAFLLVDRWVPTKQINLLYNVCFQGRWLVWAWVWPATVPRWWWPSTSKEDGSWWRYSSWAEVD